MNGLFTTTHHPESRRHRLKAAVSAHLFKLGTRLSPGEARRFAEAVHSQTRPQHTAEDLLLAFLHGGIPAVIHKLS